MLDDAERHGRQRDQVMEHVERDSDRRLAGATLPVEEGVEIGVEPE
jgi:hypothetical protein